MRSLRLLLTAVGVLAILGLSASAETNVGKALGGAAFFALAFATAIGWSEPADRSGAAKAAGRRSEVGSMTMWLTGGAVAITAAAAVQSWFHVGTVIAQGDIAPPAGTAWLSHVFDSSVWSGSDFGGASQLRLHLPWATVEAIVTSLGGAAELAQRIWYTVLFAASGVGAFLLLSLLRASIPAAIVGAGIYVLNPYVVSVVNLYPNYWAALFLFVAYPAVVVAAGRGKLSMPAAIGLVAITAPLLGYTYLNPPLAGLTLLMLVASPLLALMVDGRHAAGRALRAVGFGLGLLLLISAYWIVPAALDLQNLNPQLSTLSSWTWTEGRANLVNGFWLNTLWGWKFPEYFPYASVYDTMPFSLLKYALPALAFAGLSLRGERFRLGLAASTIALFSILLSTGTNPPGGAIFAALYNLPFGWLLREPGRFLLVAALGYAVLGSLVVDRVMELEGSLARKYRIHAASKYLGPAVVAAAVAAVGFPLWTGQIVPDSKPSLPSAHVRVPGYWPEMANFVNNRAASGGVLVLPPDDYYQMLYTWGYYGTDAFIPQFFDRRVLVPNRQGYGRPAEQLVGAVERTSQSILSGDWNDVARLTEIFHTPFILVRGDIMATVPGRQIVDPASLARALEASPNFRLVHRSGPLELFASTALAGNAGLLRSHDKEIADQLAARQLSKTN